MVVCSALNIHPHAGAFVITAGAILGLCAGLLWTAQGSLMLAYPTGQSNPTLPCDPCTIWHAIYPPICQPLSRIAKGEIHCNLLGNFQHGGRRWLCSCCGSEFPLKGAFGAKYWCVGLNTENNRSFFSRDMAVRLVQVCFISIIVSIRVGVDPYVYFNSMLVGNGTYVRFNSSQV